MLRPALFVLVLASLVEPVHALEIPEPILSSAFFSGLTLGLLGLDKLSLEIIEESGSHKQKQFAKKILPVRRDGNLLLVTLLLGNVAVNSALSILLADVAGGLLGFFVSTALIVLFGEIFPQSACSRHPLPIGAALAPLVTVLMFLIYPLAKPIAKLLDKVLGEEAITKYSKEELLKLLHVQRTQHHILSDAETRIMSGALNFKDKTVRSIMTKLERVDMLSVDERLSFEVLFKLFKAGHSRVPVYERTPSNVVGIVYVKDLILINPEDEMPVRTIMQSHGRPLRYVFDDTTLDVMLNNFKMWHSHLAFVMFVDQNTDSDPVPEMVGIVTLEDLIEELISVEIVDETDHFLSNETLELADPRESSVSKTLFHLFNTRVIPGFSGLTENEAVGIHKYLLVAYEQIFGYTKMSEDQLARLIAESDVVDILEPLVDDPSANLYVAGDTPDSACLLLQGRIEVAFSKENFRSRVGPFTLIASSAISAKEPDPLDFTAYPISSVRYLRISRARYWDTLEKYASNTLHSSLISGPPARPHDTRLTYRKIANKLRTSKGARSRVAEHMNKVVAATDPNPFRSLGSDAGPSTPEIPQIRVQDSVTRPTFQELVSVASEETTALVHADSHPDVTVIDMEELEAQL